jgi:Ca2+-binding EF-hand superfamily protein
MNYTKQIISIGLLASVLVCNAQQGPPPKFADLIAKMDKNKDGKLSKDEIDGPLKNDFAKVDLNKDGFITEDEFKKAAPPAPKVQH